LISRILVTSPLVLGIGRPPEAAWQLWFDQISQELGRDWAAYIPVITGITGVSVGKADYRLVAGLAFLNFEITWTADGSAKEFSISPPATLVYKFALFPAIFRSGGVAYSGTGYYNPDGTIHFVRYDNAAFPAGPTVLTSSGWIRVN
jgi:hypothetical protein